VDGHNERVEQHAREAGREVETGELLTPLNLYGHLMSGDEREAAARLDLFLLSSHLGSLSLGSGWLDARIPAQ
jgi:hypothetical protein